MADTQQQWYQDWSAFAQYDVQQQDFSMLHYLDVLQEHMTGIATHAQQLQLSIHGHLVALPGTRSIAAWLCILAALKFIPSCLQQLKLTGWTIVLLLYLTAELCFAVYQQFRIKAHQPTVPKPSDLPSGLGTWYLEHIRGLDLRLDELVSGWFFGTPATDVPRRNVQHYFAYIFHMAAYDCLQADEQAEVDAVVQHFEQRIGQPFKSGYNPSIKFMGHLWEPLRVVHLPLLVYIAVEVAGWAADLILWCMGFTACMDAATRTKYWIYDPSCEGARAASGGGWLPGRLLQVSRAHLSRLHDSFSSYLDLEELEARYNSGTAIPGSKQRRSMNHKRPVVFLHGVMGLLLCLPLIKTLLERCRDHPMILLDVRSVSMRLCRRSLDYDEVATAAASVLQAEGLGPAVFVCHSYGTLVMSRVYRMFPQIVAAQVLLEPVSLLPVWPALLHNFVYKIPTLQSVRSWRQFVVLLRALLARELAVADTFGRKFMWYKLITWPQELPRNTVVALAANDDLVPYNEVRINLPRGVVQLHHPYGAHGEALTNWAFQQQIATAVVRLLKRLGHKKLGSKW